MSAGGLSYSAITNHGKITLPSVETWGTNNNILRDVPKGIYTRRKDKVGETSFITDYIDDSTDRACEAIRLYPLGVNQFTSVSYSNNGNNGGQRSSGLTSLNTTTQAKLPYQILNGGAFRPPVLLQEDLLPLSRLPRNWTNAFSQPGFADFSRKMRTCGTAEETKEVKNQTLQGYVRPTAVYKIETPLEKPFEVKYVIQPTINTSVSSGTRTMDITQQHVGDPTKEIDHNPLHAHAQANYTDTTKYVDNNDFNPARYIQDANVYSVGTNISSNKYVTAIEDILDLSDMPIKDIRISMVNAPVSGVEQTKYFHDDMQLERRLPEYYATTNVGDTTIHKNIPHENKLQLNRNMPIASFQSNPVSKGNGDISSREARLHPKINPGGYVVPAQVPIMNRVHNTKLSKETEKSRMNKMIIDNMQDRYT